MDCLRVAKRLGAPTVRCVYRRTEAEAPARIEEIRHAKEEGIEFFFLHAPVEVYADADGNVTRHEGRGDGPRRARREGPPQAHADGQVQGPRLRHGHRRARHEGEPNRHASPRRASQLNKWGNIAADDGKPESTQATNLPGVFAGGDIVTGGATVILAMGAGRRAAKSIATYLSSGKKWPLTAGGRREVPAAGAARRADAARTPARPPTGARGARA